MTDTLDANATRDMMLAVSQSLIDQTDVLTDAVMAFPLLRVGGIMAFDDYLWTVEAKGEENPLFMPKPAIDAFANLFLRKMSVMRGGVGEQHFLRKHSD